MNDDEHRKHSWHDDVPYPRRWLLYVTVKLIVVLLAVIVTLHLFGAL